MKKLIHWVGAVALTLLPAYAHAQTQLPPVKDWGGRTVPGAGTMLIGADGVERGTSSNPLVVTGGTGGGGGGTGDASASNQTAQIARETSIRDQIGALTSPATGSTNWLLTDVRTALLGTLTVGTHAVTQSGAWSVGLAAGSATIGSIANTTFGAKLQDSTGAPVGTATNPIVVDSLYRGASTDRGGIFGTTATQLVAFNAARRGLSIQVQGTTGSCYINGSATATADYHSLQIPAGNYWESPDGYSGTGAVSIICTAASMSVYARER